MYPQVSFPIPQGMDQKRVAETFAAYLLGARAHHSQGYGPFNESAGYWQLDASNDYFLREEAGQCVLSCRYHYQVPIIHAMATLFSLRMHLTDVTFEPGDYMLIDPNGQISRLSQDEFRAQITRPD